jgi:hypothetical protein
MVCSDMLGGAIVSTGPAALMKTEEKLSALSPSEREHFLESFAYHKDMLVELAKK